MYVFSLFKYLTDDGGNVFKGQVIFAAVDVAVTLVVLLLYKSNGTVKFWWWPLLLLSKRVHSIFVLRLFNDGIAVLFGYTATYLFICKKWRLGSLLYSIGVSIKMNILLYAPGVLLVLLLGTGLRETIICLSICAVVQLVLGWPFLSTYPIPYIARSFDLGRVFMHKWTVNFKFVPESIFVSKPFSLALLFMTVLAFALFAIKWIREIRIQLADRKEKSSSIVAIIGASGTSLNADFVIFTIFMSNFIGVVFARSLHYQFYCWYFHTIPYLVYKSSLHGVVAIAVMGGIEYAFNVYPATTISSAVLQMCHLTLLFALLFVAKVPNAVSTEIEIIEKKRH